MIHEFDDLNIREFKKFKLSEILAWIEKRKNLTKLKRN